MSNDFYTPSGWPATGSAGRSSLARSEMALIEDAFDKMPTLTGNGNKAVVVNAGGTALSVTAAALALAVALTTAGSGGITLTSTGATNVTLPTTGTLATLAGVETLTNKTLTAAVASGVWTASGTWTIPAVTLGGTVTSNGQSFSGTIANLGTVTTADINGGTIDGVVIGGASAAAGNFTTLGTTGALTYGGVTLSNAVTGTGSMVLSASPTFTGTVSAAAATLSSTLTLSGSAANIALGSNFISNGGTDAGLSFDGSNNATFSANVTATGTGTFAIASGEGAVTSQASGTNAANFFLTNATTGALGRLRADNGGSLYVFAGDAIQAEFVYTASSTRRVQITGSNGGNPAISASGGELAVGTNAWTFGAANSVSPTAPNRTLTVTIGGSTYYIHAKTTND